MTRASIRRNREFATRGREPAARDIPLCGIQLITTNENERWFWSSMKSSRFLVYTVAPSERALNASKQSFTNIASLSLRSGLYFRTLAKIPPASFQ